MTPSPLPRSLPPRVRARGVTAVLGPTNTGKTHLAIERLLAHESGMIGLPLRLLAREVYNRVVERAGAEAVALITGEEKIKPANARYWIATIEAMPRDIDVAFCAIDEIQLANHFDRGHVFTDRLLNQRGRAETLVIGAATMRPLVEQLLPGANIVSRPRLSTLSFAGEKKITRLPRRSAIVAFSAEEVYAIAELIRRQHGGAAVVLGALSPRTRNAQVEIYQSGDVDYIVATDAIGMGLNLDVDHVAFASTRKFDGFGFRPLNPAEIGQIAGRAGRHLKDGTFGTTGRAEAFDAETVEAVEDHLFEPVRILQWRNPDLHFHTLADLQASLAATPSEAGLTRAPIAEDVAALDVLARDAEIRDIARGRSAVERLWEVCQVPDYRKVASAAHAELVGTIYQSLMRHGTIADDWFARQIRHVDRIDGDIDTLSGRIAQVRTWTFVANRPDWLRDPDHWQNVTRQVEDRLSDALHERLASRFVDRRTSVLMRRLRENAMLEAEVTTAGDVLVEGQHIGRLQGFQFAPDAEAEGQANGQEARGQEARGQEVRALRAAAQKALTGEIEARAERLANSGDDSFVLANDGMIRWNGDIVARLTEGEKVLTPGLRLIADDTLAAGAREKVEARLVAWLKAHVTKLLGSLDLLESAEEITGIARGIAFQIAEALGVLERSRVAQDVKGLDQESRAVLRKFGVRFGAYHLYIPQLLKPAPRALATQLWALKSGGLDQPGIDDIAHLAASGRTSFKVLPDVAKGLYRAAGFRVCGERVLRVDILERLADLIRPAIAYKPGVTPGEPPAGAADGDGFVVTVAMTSLAGCAGEDFASILRSLGYIVEKRPGPAITVALVPAPRLISPAAPAQAPETAETTAAGPTATEAAATEATAAETATEAATTDTAAAEVTAAEVTATEVIAADVTATDLAATETTVTDAAAEAPADDQEQPAPAADTPAQAETQADTPVDAPIDAQAQPASPSDAAAADEAATVEPVTAEAEAEIEAEAGSSATVAVVAEPESEPESTPAAEPEAPAAAATAVAATTTEETQALEAPTSEAPTPEAPAPQPAAETATADGETAATAEGEAAPAQTAAATEDGAPAAEIAAAEIPEIEIWRPHRHQFGQHRAGERRGHGAGGHGAGGHGAGGHGAGGHGAGGRNQHRQPSADGTEPRARADRRPHPSQPGAEAAAGEQRERPERQRRLDAYSDASRARDGGPEGAARDGNGEGRGFGRNRSGGRGQGPAQGKWQQGRPEEGKTEHGRSEHGRGEHGRSAQGKPGHGRSEHGGRSAQGKPWQDRKSAPQRQERAPDPDSPFAKLAALKQALEARSKDKS